MYRVLIADDEYWVGRWLADVLAKSPYDIKLAGISKNGGEALERLKSDQIDILITDINMPVASGLALLKELEESGRKKPKTIIISGYDEFEYAKAALQVEAVDYILKPFSFEKIRKAAERVRELLHKEELLKMSVRVYGKKLLCRVIDNDGETGREACRQFLDVCEWDKEEWFGLITTTAGLDDTVIEQVENSLSEVVYSIRGGG